MELWIRSQDKEELVKIESIFLTYDYLCSDEIQLVHIETDKGCIGSYGKTERALEILDEIQNLLDDISKNKNVGCVYQMPEKNSRRPEV